MTERIILDTGLLVALINADDQFHAWARASMSPLPPPYYTCEAVVTETCHLLRRAANGQENLIGLIHKGIVLVPFCLQDEAGPIRGLMTRYADVPMSVADACLVRMSELHPDSLVVTTDSDFHIYRRNGRQSIPLLTPRR